MFCGNRRSVKDESGQTIVFAIITMVVFIAMAGFAVDVGHAYLVQRQLQSAADAAALAGALDLPDKAAATQTANDYGPAPGKRNPPHSNDNAAITVETKCVTSIPGCSIAAGTVNAIGVHATSNVKTVFAKIVGLDSFTVHANATACSPCSVKPLDIMLVLDRTGSMCQVSNPRGGVMQDPMVNQINPATGQPYGNPAGCTDLTNAKNGISTFLALMKPQYDHVGLAVLPPVADASTQAGRCVPPTQNPSQYNYDNRNADYTIVGLSSDYASPAGTLNAGSNLVRAINCLPSAGNTAYADAIESAQNELATTGRAGVQKVIIFLSDGAANYGGTWHPAGSPYRTTPCRQGITSSNIAKTAGTTVYTIGYDLNGSGTDPEQCTDTPSITSLAAMQAIASSPDTFYNKPDPGQLNTIFARIAADIFRTAQLIDDSLT